MMQPNKSLQCIHAQHKEYNQYFVITISGVYMCQLLSHVQLFATPQTVVYQASQSKKLILEWVAKELILEWVAIPSSRGSSQPRDRTCISCIAGRFFTILPPGKPINGVQPLKIVNHCVAHLKHVMLQLNYTSI